MPSFMSEKQKLTEEALEDVERFNKAAQSEGLPRANEYTKCNSGVTVSGTLFWSPWILQRTCRAELFRGCVNPLV